jgi:anaerobic selenocysteine-containing dehydrogenase
MMNEKGIPVSRWIDGVLEAKENVDQPDNVKGHGVLGSRPELADPPAGNEEAMEKLDTLVVIDPYPDHDRPSCTTARMASTCCRPRRSSRPTAR